MSAKDELIAAREAMASVLDAKLATLPEWQAYRRIEKAIAALQSERVFQHHHLSAEPGKVSVPGVALTFHKVARQPSYVDLAIQAIVEKGSPLPTPDIVLAIGKRRSLDADPDKVRINISTSLSKDPRIVNVPWQGGKAWWIAGQELPPRNDLAEPQRGSA